MLQQLLNELGTNDHNRDHEPNTSTNVLVTNKTSKSNLNPTILYIYIPFPLYSSKFIGYFH